MIKKKLYQNLLAVFMLLANISLSAVHIWEPLTVLDTVQGIRTAKIVCDGNDNGAAVWFDSAAAQIGVSFRPAGGLWEPAVNYPIVGNNPVDITMDQNGNVTVCFADGTATPGSPVVIKAIYRPIGGSWGPAVTIYPGANNVSMINLSCSSTATSTQAIVAWVENSATGVVKSLYRTGTTWSGTVQTVAALTSASTGLEKIIIKMYQSNGAAQIAMLVQYGGTFDVYHTTSPSGGAAWFGPPTSLNFVGIGGSPQDMDFAVNQANGDAIVIEQHNSLNIFYNRRFSGSWLANPLVVQAGPAFSPRIGIANSNLTQGIWEHTGLGEIQTKGSTVAAAMTWPTPTTLATSPSLSFPAISMSPSGYFVMGWLDAGSVTTRIGSGSTLEPNTTILDTIGNGILWSVCMGDNDVAWAIWNTGNTIRVSKTIFPQPTASGTLLQILGKKRLIYQKGLFP